VLFSLLTGSEIVLLVQSTSDKIAVKNIARVIYHYYSTAVFPTLGLVYDEFNQAQLNNFFGDITPQSLALQERQDLLHHL
jgi:hypothetical protein